MVDKVSQQFRCLLTHCSVWVIELAPEASDLYQGWNEAVEDQAIIYTPNMTNG